LANDSGYVALRRAAEDRDGWTVETKNVKNLLYQVQQKTILMRGSNNSQKVIALVSRCTRNLRLHTNDEIIKFW